MEICHDAEEQSQPARRNAHNEKGFETDAPGRLFAQDEDQ
ncbi:MAG: hypothetical protein BWY95_02391 [Bacteroidetes bacterium ADurb.BinA104]|nr:MAG: hypothetical protein BWY95_02391 [Bacteroidetes bacterium ADurb.BinA104]